MTITPNPPTAIVSRWRRFVSASLLLALSLALAPSALAQGQEEQGGRLLSEVEQGETDCGDLDDQEFTAIGEFIMGRMLGSPQAHEAMDRVMASMMGEAGLERMHEVMGERLSGCGRPSFPAGAGPMMQALGGGMMGGFAGPGQDYGPGSGPGQGYGPGSGPGQGYGPGSGSGGMMGFDRDTSEDDDGPGAWMAVLMLVVVAGVGVAAFAIARPRRGVRSGPLDLLAQRFARGEMTADDYEQRRALLEGGDR